MTTNINKPLALLVSWVLCIPLTPVSAQETGEQNTLSQETEQIVAEENGAVEVIVELQAEPAPVYQPKDAEEQATAWVESKGLVEGWNARKKTYIQIGSAIFDSEDPSYDESFIAKRSLKSMEATLNAKAGIIEYINTSMSAMDKVTTPGTDLHALFNQKLDNLKKKSDAQKRQIAKLLEDFDQKEADALRGVTLGDRANSFMDAAIKKLDEEYSTADIEEKKKEKFQKAKQRYQESVAESQELAKEIEAQAGQVTQESSSSVETMSKMPLFGAVTVQQFESWDEDEERYRVALVVAWGPKMEKVVRAMIKGEDIKAKPGKLSLRDWLAKQNWATSTGGRRFKDDRGVPYFIGIAASALGTSSGSENQAKGMSALFAKKEVAMSIFADIESHKKAEAMMQERSAGRKTASEAAESFSQELQASIKNRSISGLQKMVGKKVVHPISGQKIYVSVYGLSIEGARQAMQMQESNYLTKILDIKSQQKLKGTKAGLDAAVKTTEQDRSSYNKARSESYSSARRKTADKPISRPKSQPTAPVKPDSADDDYRPGKDGPRSGVYGGEGDDEDFDW